MRTHMRILTFVAASFLLIAATSLGQFRMPGGGGGKGPGGFAGGNFSANKNDPNQLFDMLRRDKPYIVISEIRSPNLRDQLMQYARDNHITNDQINRQQFTSVYAKYEQMKAAAMSGTPGGSGGPGSPGGSRMFPPRSPDAPPTPSGPAPQGPGGFGVNPLEAIGQWAETDFKRRDHNGDNRLNPDEMPDALRSQLDRWDTDHDGLISLDEYKVYYSARLQMRDGPSQAPTNPIHILIEDDYDRRPEVIRAGKLPKELPKWFNELDTDQDGQVALFEWHKAGKDIEEFKEWDRNDDGLLTPQEVLFKQNGSTAVASRSQSDRPAVSTVTVDSNRPEGGGRPGGFGGFGGKGGGGFGKGGGGGFRDFFKNKGG